MRSYSDISIGDSGYSCNVKIRDSEGIFILEFEEKEWENIKLLICEFKTVLYEVAGSEK